MQLANVVDTIPVCQTTAERNARFGGSPSADQRCHNKQTGYIERYDINVVGWVQEFIITGATVPGYSAMTGAQNRATVYDVAAVTLPQLAGRVAALQADLTTKKIIGP